MIQDHHSHAGHGQTEVQAAELEIMRRVLAASRGVFSLSLATCNSPELRDFVISTLRKDEPNIEVVSPPAGTTDVLAAVRKLASNTGRTALFVVGLERSLPSTSAPGPDNAAPEALATLQTLNASRDMWPGSFACPVVFWLGEYAGTFLALHAPDFWAWISHRFLFVSELATAAAGVADTASGDLSMASNMTEVEKHLRIAELEARIADAGDEPPKNLAPHVATWLNEAGVLKRALGDLHSAEVMYRKALAIAERLGSLEGAATFYGNLGLVEYMHGDLDLAEEMLGKALEIDGKLGRLEGMANHYTNLGVSYEMRGDLDRAEEMQRKALAINEKLGHRAGMAIQYGNLGMIYLRRGDEDRAENLQRKALTIDEELDLLEGLASDYGGLGVICVHRGDLDRAEEMLRRAMAIEKQLGRAEGMARGHANLGLIYESRGDADEARRLWTTARDIYAKIPMPHMVKKVQAWLDRLDDPGPGSPDSST